MFLVCIIIYWFSVVLLVKSDGANVLDAVEWNLGSCYNEPQGERDRSGVIIKLLERDWISHRLSTFIAAIVLREFYRYDIKLVIASSAEFHSQWQSFLSQAALELPSNFEAFPWLVDMEQWRSMTKTPESVPIAEVREGVNKSVFDTPFPIGYTGRSGLYILPQVAHALQMPDYYKFYKESGFARSAGFLGFNPVAFRASVANEDFPVCTNSANWCSGTGDKLGYWIPDWCSSDISACIEVWMGPPDWDSAYFEQLANNTGQLKMVFAYHTASAWASRRHELSTNPRAVVFYSFVPSRGAEFQNGIRISFPDGILGCRDGDTQWPSGPVDCDYPEVTLVKLIGSDIQKTPEAMWFLRKFSITKEEMTGLVNQLQSDASRQEVFNSACDFVKTGNWFSSRMWAEYRWDCTKLLDPGNTFRESLGYCSPKPVTHQERGTCFPNRQSSRDRSSVTIRIASKDWMSHYITESVNGILLQELLGYTVLYEPADHSVYDKFRWGALFEDDRVDFEPESWAAGDSDPTVKTYVEDKGLVMWPIKLGYMGREGLYVLPGTATLHPYSSFYRFFHGSRAHRVGFPRFHASTLMNSTNGTLFCEAPDHAEHMPWCYRESASNMSHSFVPPICVAAPESCASVVMMLGLYQPGQFEQLIRNHNLNLVLDYFGPTGWSRMLENNAREGIPSVFYGWEPHPPMIKLGITSEHCRVSFPDWYTGCDGPETLTDRGSRLCDISMAILRKILRSTLKQTAPEAVHAMINLEISNSMIHATLSQTQDAGGQMSAFEAACWFVQTYTDAVKIAVPDCIRTPKSNDDVRMRDEVWSPLNFECINMTCSENSFKSFTPSLVAEQWEPGCEVCNHQSPGFVPTSDQLKCSSCEVGKASNANGDACEHCPPGKYSRDVGNRSCESCAKGRYNPLWEQHVCTLCPFGGNCSVEGAITFTAEEGFYIFRDAVAIITEYGKRRNSSSFDADLTYGFQHIGPFKCLAEGACKGNNECVKSQDGRPAMEGLLCSSCAPGFVRSKSSAICDQCPESAQNYGVLFFLIIGFGIVLFTIDRVNAVAAGNVRETSAVVLKVLCNFFILVSVIARNIRLSDLLLKISERGPVTFSFALPLTAALGLGGGLENPGRAVFSLGCFFNEGDSFKAEYVTVIFGWVMIPMGTLLLAAVVGISWLWRRRSFNFRIAFVAITVVALYFLHPMATSSFLTVFDCTLWDANTGLRYDTRRLALNMKIDCDSTEHRSWMYLGLAGILFISFGIPIFYWVKLRQIHHSTTTSLNHKNSLRKYGFLYEGFEPELYYYECIYMMRKVCYLLGGSFYWLEEDSRSVLLLTMNCIFLGLHLHCTPYDNRAYFGLDRLETWSSITLITLLLGRIFEAVSKGAHQTLFRDHEEVWYAPAFVAFMWFACQAIYLFIRSLLWPLNYEPYLLPNFITSRLGQKLELTFVPQDEEFRPHQDMHEHSILHHPRSSRKSTGASIRSTGAVPSRERELLKTVCAETIELLLIRHEMCTQEAPKEICLPTFMLQLERALILFTCNAIKDKIVVHQLIDERATWTDCCKGFVGDTLQYGVDLLKGSGSSSTTMMTLIDINWASTRDKTLDERRDLIRSPLSCEELHASLMYTGTLLLQMQQAARESNPVREIAENHKGILDMFVYSSWLFHRDGHQDRVFKFKASDELSSANGDDEQHVALTLGKESGKANPDQFALQSDDSDTAPLSPHRGVSQYALIKDLCNLREAIGNSEPTQSKKMSL